MPCYPKLTKTNENRPSETLYFRGVKQREARFFIRIFANWICNAKMQKQTFLVSTKHNCFDPRSETKIRKTKSQIL